MIFVNILQEDKILPPGRLYSNSFSLKVLQGMLGKLHLFHRHGASENKTRTGILKLKREINKHLSRN